MTDLKLSALTALATPNQEDLLFVVDDPGGSPLSRKSTIQQVQAGMGVGAKAKATTDQTIGDDTWTAVALDLEDFDDAAYHDTVTNNSRMTIPSGYDGRYLLVGHVHWSAPNDTKPYLTGIYKNGTLLDQGAGVSVAGSVASIQCTIIDNAVAGDYYELYAYQNSGGNEDTNNSYFSIQKVG